MANAIKNWFSTLTDVRRDELVPVVLMLVYGFLAMTSYYVVKPARNALFVERLGAENLPWVYIITAIVVSLVMIGYSRYVNRIGHRTLLLGTFAFLASNLVLFRWMLLEETFLTSGIFYVWGKLYPLLLVSQFYLAGNLLFTTRQAKRLFGPIGVGLILGGIAGSSIAGTMADLMGTENLLLVAAGILGGCALIVVALSPRMTAGERASGRLVDDISGDAVRLLFQSAHLRSIAAILLMTILVTTLVDWQFNRAVELYIPGEDAKTEFFGRFFLALNIVSVTIQVLLTAWVLRRWGVGVALLALPLGLLVATVGVFLAPILLTAALAKGTEGALRYSLDQSTRELLFLPVPTDVKYKVKPLIDLAVYRGGTGIGGILLLIFTNGLGLGLRGVAVVATVMIGVWVLATFRMRREFKDSVKRLIGIRDVGLRDLIVQRLQEGDGGVDDRVRSALEGGDEEEIIYSLGLVRHQDPRAFTPELRELLQHDSPEVRGRSLKLLTAMGHERLVPEARALLVDPDLDVRIAAMEYVCRYGSEDPEQELRDALGDEAWGTRAAAIAVILRYGGTVAPGNGEAAAVEEDHPLPVGAEGPLEVAEGREPEGVGPEGRRPEGVGPEDRRPDGAGPEGRRPGGAPGRGPAGSGVFRVRGFEGAGAEALHALSQEEALEARVYAAQLLVDADLDSEPGQRVMRLLLDDPDPSVRHAAMQAAAATDSGRFLPLLVDRLAVPRDRNAAVEALSRRAREIRDLLFERLEAVDASPSQRLSIPRILRDTADQDTVDRLVEALERAPDQLRFEILKTLGKLRRDRDDLEFGARYDIDELVDREIRSAYLWARRCAVLFENGEDSLLRHLLVQRMEESAERAFRLLGLQHPLEDLEASFTALRSEDDLMRQRGFELVDNALPRTWRDRFDPLLNPEKGDEERRAAAEERFGVPEESRDEILEDLSREEGLSVRSLAVIERTGEPVEGVLTPERLREEMASRISLVLDHPHVEEAIEIMDVLQRADVLRKSRIFRDLRGEELAGIAALMEERELEADEAMTTQAERGGALHVVVEGRLEGRADGQALYVAGPGDALVDPSFLDGREPELEVMATEDTRLLTIPRVAFVRLMEERFTVVRGLMAHVAGMLREMRHESSGSGEATGAAGSPGGGGGGRKRETEAV